VEVEQEFPLALGLAVLRLRLRLRLLGARAGSDMTATFDIGSNGLLRDADCSWTDASLSLSDGTPRPCIGTRPRKPTWSQQKQGPEQIVVVVVLALFSYFGRGRRRAL